MTLDGNFIRLLGYFSTQLVWHISRYLNFLERLKPHGPRSLLIFEETRKFPGKYPFPAGNFLVPNFMFPAFLPGNLPLYTQPNLSIGFMVGL